MPSMKYFLATVDGKRTLFDYAKDIPKGVEAKEIEIQTDKSGLHAAIQELLTEADEANASVQEPIEPKHEPEVQPKAVVPGYTEWSVKLDEVWDKLPLAHKLHFASLAMEEARLKL